MAHVYGHCDFFKNNLWFAHTDRKMMDRMANDGNRIRRYMDRFGVEEVEEFIDACLSIEDLIDVHSTFIKRADPRPPRPQDTTREDDEQVRVTGRFPSKDYMDHYVNPPHAHAGGSRTATRLSLKETRFPPEPVRDVMLFVLENAPLKNWQLDVLSIVPRRSLLFRPAGSDEDHERRLGQLLAFDDHDPPGADRLGSGLLLRPPFGDDGQQSRPVEPLQDGHRAFP